MADTMLKGSLLVASPLLTEPTFARTVVAILQHAPDDGALGVVLNRPAELSVSDAVPPVADLVTPPATLFVGGPVSPSTALALGMAAPGAEPNGWAVVVPPLVTVDLDSDPALLAASLRALRVFVGYAGWSAGQLEAEIAQGAWYVVDSLPLDPFGAAPDRLWSTVLRRQGWPLAAVALCPLDPTLN